MRWRDIQACPWRDPSTSSYEARRVAAWDDSRQIPAISGRVRLPFHFATGDTWRSVSVTLLYDWLVHAFRSSSSYVSKPLCLQALMSSSSSCLKLLLLLMTTLAAWSRIRAGLRQPESDNLAQTLSLRACWTRVAETLLPASLANCWESDASVSR